MIRPLKTTLLAAAIILLAACGSNHKSPPKTQAAHTQTKKAQTVRITHIDRNLGAQELMLQSISLIGTPYKYGGSSTATGFDCSGMIQYVYQNALGVSLPRTARDMAAASREISQSRLNPGDLVFFNTGGRSKYSHVGLYIGNGEFIHAPSSNGTIRTEKLSSPYFSKRFVGAHTFF